MKRLFVSLAICVTLILGMTARAQSPRAGDSYWKLEIENKGTITIKLHTKEAPKTTAHIAKLAKSGFYDGQRFFRVTWTPRPYLAQSGDPLSKDKSKLNDSRMGTGGSGTRIPFEDSGYSHEEGAVGLAAQPNDRNSGDSQFYIVLGASRFLDGNYTIFGKVVGGMEVVRKLEVADRITSSRITSAP